MHWCLLLSRLVLQDSPSSLRSGARPVFAAAKRGSARRVLATMHARNGRLRWVSHLAAPVALLLSVVLWIMMVRFQSDLAGRARLLQKEVFRKVSDGARTSLRSPPVFNHFPTCEDDFHVSIANSPETVRKPGSWPCLVRAPEGYRPPFERERALWAVPRTALGELDRSNPEFLLHVNRQRWTHIDQRVVSIRTVGGTSGRAFGDNFKYVRALLSMISLSPRCGSRRPPIMLDMGGGIGSVAAAFADKRGAAGKITVVSYVWPDNYLRLQTIMSHRLLPAYLANFTGKVPFPNESVDIVHCKWCWHHVVGYDIWLDEVQRVLVPGGYFLFTFTPKNDKILRHPEWDQALARQPFECKRVKRIVLVCRKKIAEAADRWKALNSTTLHDHCPKETRMVLASRDVRPTILQTMSRQRSTALQSLTELLHEGISNLSRILNVNCVDATLCQTIDASHDEATVTHLGGSEAIVSGLLARRRVALQHDWNWNLPVYPRTYDLVYVGCDNSTNNLLHQETFWADLHRVLRPGGGLIMQRALCSFPETSTPVLKACGFEAKTINEDVIVGRRLDAV